jgi:hypothetical protein
MFITKWGFFKPLVMYFGMCNAPATFQQMMDILFQKVLTSGRVFIYVDNVLIASNDLEELCYWMHEVLTIMRESRLLCKPIKCQFEQWSIKYLGTIIGYGQTAINPKKAEVIAEWPTPWNLKDMQLFLGTCNFWWKFIRGFSMIMHPLHDLVKKGIPFEWTEECQAVFSTLKHMITTAPVLCIPQEDLLYLVETDASGVALGTVLSQQHEGSWHPVDFHSWSLTLAEWNYPAQAQNCWQSSIR